MKFYRCGSIGGTDVTTTDPEEVPSELQEIEKDSVTLVIAESHMYIEVITKLLKFVGTQKFSVICVTVGRPYESLVELLSKKRIPSSKIFFIDAITPTLGGKPKRIKNCTFVASSSNLTDLGIALEQQLRRLEKPTSFSSSIQCLQLPSITISERYCSSGIS